MKISFRQNQCIDQRLFNVKETTQRVTVTVRGEDRDSYSRGARIQLDGSTDVNGERERERDTMARPLHSSSLSYLSPEPVRSSLVGNGRGVRGRGRPRRRRVKSTRCQPREPGEREPPSGRGRRARRSFSVCRREPPASACIYLPLWKRTTTPPAHPRIARLHAQIILPDI